MTNLEKYRSELEPYVFSSTEWGVINGKIDLCSWPKCMECLFNEDYEPCVLKRVEWLQKEYSESKEQDIDWTRVAVDTPILVSYNGKEWCKRHFYQFKKGKVFAFDNGHTSWSGNNNDISKWNYAKLAERDKNNDY